MLNPGTVSLPRSSLSRCHFMFLDPHLHFNNKDGVLTQTDPSLNVQLFSYCKLFKGALLRGALRHTQTPISRAANQACWALSSCLSLRLTPPQGEAGLGEREEWKGE